MVKAPSTSVPSRTFASFASFARILSALAVTKGVAQRAQRTQRRKRGPHVEHKPKVNWSNCRQRRSPSGPLRPSRAWREPLRSFDCKPQSCKTLFVKTTIDLPEELLRRVEAEAALRGRNPCELVLEGIQHVLECRAAEAAPHLPGRRFADGCGIVNSGVGDLSSNPKHLEGFGRISIK